ncbi:hypothetical protein [Candidatus Aquarickettsia rohweri]|nr:hypothetical protein [Candidatus Aquarickettsia rohweri]
MILIYNILYSFPGFVKTCPDGLGLPAKGLFTTLSLDKEDNVLDE